MSSKSGKLPKIIHDREHCIGCHSCVNLAPHTWCIDPADGQARLINGQKKGRYEVAEIFPEDVADNQKAAQACPMNIIKIS